ncbi:MAG TPA: hypothetical protein PK367_02670 [Candidatus Paceibacterota bacterium]|nr:hypothetical protein [Candidatus Paceibacterota bacterium]
MHKSKHKDSKKENLILVHSFPTNSILLNGLKEYLDEFFNVFFVDLPGFTKKTDPLLDISIDKYSDYLENKINQYKFSHYIIGGISFGFIVVNNTKLDPRKCRAILAIEPYINCKYLRLGFIQRFLYTHLLDKLADNKFLIDKIWNNRFADDVLAFLSGQTLSRMQTIIKEIDGKTFFDTAKCIIDNNKRVVFKKNIPYILLINNNDETVSSKKIVSLFQNKLTPRNLLVVYTNVEHYPKNVSKKYFKEKISDENLETILSYLKK